MRRFTLLCLSVCLFTGAPTIYADKDHIDCEKESLADAVNGVKAKDFTIHFTGVCAGPIVIGVDGLTLKGVGNAIIDGGGQDAVKVAGTNRVSLSNFEVRNGLNGILVVNGGHVTLKDVNSHDNNLFGISIQTASSAALTDVAANRNRVFGLDVQTGSAVTATGSLTTSMNGVFGINVNGSSITFTDASVTANGNALGIQIATGIYAYTPEQRRRAEASRDAYQKLLSKAGYGPITTEILDAPEFYYAEDYHQQYLAKNPGGYCGLGGTGVACQTGLVEAAGRATS